MAKLREFLGSLNPQDLVTKTPEELAGEQNLSDFKARQKQELGELKSNLKKVENIRAEDRLMGIEKILIQQKPELLEELADYLRWQQDIENSFKEMARAKKDGKTEEYTAKKNIWTAQKKLLEDKYHVNAFFDESTDQKENFSANRELAALIRQQRLGALSEDERGTIQDIIINIQQSRRDEKEKMRFAMNYARTDISDRFRERIILEYTNLLKRELSAKDEKFDDRENLNQRAKKDLEHMTAMLPELKKMSEDHRSQPAKEKIVDSGPPTPDAPKTKVA